MTNEPSEYARTTFTPVEVDGKATLTLRAAYFESPIDLDQLQTQCLASKSSDADTLVLNLPGGAFVVVLRFGSVIFWQCTEDMHRDVLVTIQRLPGMKPPRDQLGETVLVRAGQTEDRVTFKEVLLQSLTVEHIKIVSQAFGQSIALKQCETAVAQAMNQTTQLVQALEARGRLLPSERDILKMVGFTLAVEETILARLTLVDDPAVTWQSERLARLHNLLYEHFDLKKRLSALQAKLQFLSNMNQIAMDLLQNRTSHRLEIIVIVLIVVELLLSCAHFFAGGH